MSKTPALFLTTVPFDGFYNSIHSEAIDYAEETLCEDSDGRPYTNIADILGDRVDWSQVFYDYSKTYVSWFSKKYEFQYPLIFDELRSPKYYNFQADRIFAYVSRRDLARMLCLVRGKHLNRAIKERFTSRSGFISFYPNNIKDWPPVRDWDHNHVGTVLATFCEQNHTEWEAVDDLMPALPDLIYEAADFIGQAAIDLASLKRRIEEEQFSLQIKS